ncbi:hypothetical protein N7491_001862 [Penicillium cf. griseofulvum]|nr:hypothetical protein N7491_001862 [Penicillium cf. griseofulvum]KAJ5447502.1 hypothetical protein N7445_002323 [Penicillium cf. griseofulvum]
MLIFSPYRSRVRLLSNLILGQLRDDAGSIPSILQKGPSNAAPPFILELLTLAIGVRIFKQNVSPIILDQIRQTKSQTKHLKSGEMVIVDPDATAARTMLFFYGFMNIGAFGMLATYAEKYIGYWLSFY